MKLSFEEQVNLIDLLKLEEHKKVREMYESISNDYEKFSRTFLKNFLENVKKNKEVQKIEQSSESHFTYIPSILQDIKTKGFLNKLNIYKKPLKPRTYKSGDKAFETNFGFLNTYAEIHQDNLKRKDYKPILEFDVESSDDEERFDQNFCLENYQSILIDDNINCSLDCNINVKTDLENSFENSNNIDNNLSKFESEDIPQESVKKISTNIKEKQIIKNTQNDTLSISNNKENSESKIFINEELKNIKEQQNNNEVKNE